VTIKEADGSSRSSVPYSSVPVLQREGHTRYAVPGEYRSGNNQQESRNSSRAPCCTASRRAGRCTAAPSWRTATAPLTSAWGKHGELGALSLDVTQANATLPDDSDRQGQSVRFLYNKSLTDTGTNIQLVGYRYSAATSASPIPPTAG
jgi:outer membrane usher protein